jgi:4-aminobutyrate aminotransferase-like enzyme
MTLSSDKALAAPRLIASMHAPGDSIKRRVRSGRGVELTLEDGRVVLDAGSLSSCLLGHCHPEVVAAVEQAARTVYVNDGTGYAPREEAVEDLLRIAFRDESWAGAAALFVSSSEAADLGLLLAQLLTGREPLASRACSYHGGVGLGREISSHPLWGAHLSDPAGGVTPRPFRVAPTRELPVPECGIRVVGPDHDCSESCLRDATTTLEGTAAVMMDYSQGGVCPSPQYQDTLAAAARATGCLWIADETVTGFGRMGHAFAFQRGSTRPDMVTLGKGITAGAASGGALVLSEEIVAEIGDRRWMTSSTYRGNPITVAAMSAVQRVLDQEQLIPRAQAIGRDFGRELRETALRHDCVDEVLGEGLLWILRLRGSAEHAEDRWRGDGNATTLTEFVHDAAIDRGVFIGILGGGCLWVIPPLIITPEQLADVLEALDGALTVADQHSQAMR